MSPSKAGKEQYKVAKLAKHAPKTTVEKRAKAYGVAKVVLTLLAFATRFWRLDQPSEVVFDEVHFGKFASHYLQREYFFDLHPPFAKLLFAFVGWCVGYDGSFKFDNIGDSYIANNVPYVAYRSLAAALGAATVPLVFAILEGVGCSPAACIVGASIVLLDSAQITQTRLILLDATLLFSLSLSVYCYVRFSKLRTRSFSVAWWGWLFATGFALSCSISTKYVGLFAFLMVGSAVIPDLWHLMDVRGKKAPLSIRQVMQHFFARFAALVVWPFVLYLMWFWIHFQVLTYSGPGDVQMTPDFQSTLKENPLARDALDVNFYDIVTIQSVPANVFLHSHIERYPLRYEDGRISTQGQQVTGYSHPDINNLWQILPAVDLAPEDQVGHPLVGSQVIRLRHVATNSYLLTHDVASPGFPTNEEFTTIPPELLPERYNDTLFYLDLVPGKSDRLQTKLSQFRLKHTTTKVAMWLSDGPFLPDWGFGQFEINGNKQQMASGTLWSFGDIDLNDEERPARRSFAGSDTASKRPFWVDYRELQGTMFRSNNQLTATHPYMSSPWTWPLMLRGISFWTGKDGQSQIYLVGNYIGWYLEGFALMVFVFIVIADQITVLRDTPIVPAYARQKLYRTLLWFFGGWVFHYAPFFLMGRQLFLHHYLPAHLLAALLTACILDFLLGQLDSANIRGRTFRRTWLVSTVVVAALLWGLAFFGPLVYGLPLSPERVRARQWFNIDLHFNK